MCINNNSNFFLQQQQKKKNNAGGDNNNNGEEQQQQQQQVVSPTKKKQQQITTTTTISDDQHHINNSNDKQHNNHNQQQQPLAKRRKLLADAATPKNFAQLATLLEQTGLDEALAVEYLQQYPSIWPTFVQKLKYNSAKLVFLFKTQLSAEFCLELLRELVGWLEMRRFVAVSPEDNHLQQQMNNSNDD